jgi:putative ABC transport system permease protein
VTPLWLAAFAIAFATLVGLVSGIYPALRAAAMKPLHALRTD